MQRRGLQDLVYRAMTTCGQLVGDPTGREVEMGKRIHEPSSEERIEIEIEIDTSKQGGNDINKERIENDTSK